MPTHPFDQLIKYPDKQEADNVLIQAIAFMSATTHQHLSMQQIYDMLLADANKDNIKVLSTGVSNDPILHRLLSKMTTIQQTVYDGNAALHRSLDHVVNTILTKMEQRIADQFKHLEEHLSTATDRLDTDMKALEVKADALQAAYDRQSKAVNDANTRLTTEIKTLTDLVTQLRNEAGSGNETLINAISDRIERTTGTISGIVDGLTTSATQEDSVDPEPAPVTR